MAATRIWDLCASSSEEFKIYRTKRNQCVKCKDIVDTGNHRAVLTLQLRDSTYLSKDGRPHISDVLRKEFGFDRQNPSCQKCKGQDCVKKRTWLINDSLPYRLAVATHPTYRDICGATDDRITFEFESKKYGPQVAAYRWKGSICATTTHHEPNGNDTTHYKTYMSGPTDGRGLMAVYDGQMLEGAIIGDVPPAHVEHKPDAHWALGTDMLFYERVEIEPKVAPQPTRPREERRSVSKVPQTRAKKRTASKDPKSQESKRKRSKSSRESGEILG